ncbi:MAG: HD-GYP domain-containing protein [Acidobacteriota bacterium]
MTFSWEAEYRMLSRTAELIGSRGALPEAPPEVLEEHARDIFHLQNILGLVASLPPSRRPPLESWDDILGPLWRRLFAQGADIDRYTLADLWRKPLGEAGLTDRFLRSTTAVAASARNFYRFGEALELCREGRRAARGRKSGALANLINTEGLVHVCLGDLDSAEACYREAMALASSLDDGELARWSGLNRTAFIGQERLNLLDLLLRQGFAATGREAAGYALRARQGLEELALYPLGEGFRHLLLQDRAELALLEGKPARARAILGEMYFESSSQGPYRYSLQAMQSRLMAQAFAMEGDWTGAHHWIRKAVKESVGKCYPAEEQFVLSQAVAVLKGLHGGDPRRRQALIRDLVNLLEEKDWYTGRSHARSVSRLASRLARRLKSGDGWALSPETLATAGLLHDIGKLKIPWSLLNKIAPLTPKELAILRDHATSGAQILREIGMAEIAPIVEQHHEAPDGSGYPRGIPPSPAAAVIAVCDAFEASVTPNRRYKEPKPTAAALAELVGGSGRRYRAEVVEALVRTVQAHG